MAHVIQVPYVTGQTVYALVFRMEDGFVWNIVSEVWEDYASGNYTDYAFAAAEIATGAGIYEYDFSVPFDFESGGYRVVFKVQAGGAPAQSDLPIWTEDVWWTPDAVAGPAPGPSPSALQVTGYLYTFDEDGVIEPTVTIKCLAKDIVASSEEMGEIQFGYALDEAVRTVVSDGAGLASFPNLFKGVTYLFWRGTGDTGRQFSVTIPADAADPYELPSILGIP